MNRRKVCLLHVGGTIGMVRTDTGYAPAPGFLEDYLARMPELQGDAVPDHDLVVLDPLLDSADMLPRDWHRVAGAIVERASAYAGFVVLHGTDTMAYTASALSFLLRGLDRPVVFTGSQLSLEHPRSDGREHVITAMILAGTLDVPEVCIYFRSRLLRGNRAQKIHNQRFFAFDSGNLPPLATVGIEIEVAHHLIRPPGPGLASVMEPVDEPRVAALRVFPGMGGGLIESVLDGRLRGLVLETYGAGNFPSSDAAALAAIARAVDHGVVVVNCSQCHGGSVRQGLYSTGHALAEVGVIGGHDMTPEAALTKLYWLLGSGLDTRTVREQVATDIAGELDPSA